MTSKKVEENMYGYTGNLDGEGIYKNIRPVRRIVNGKSYGCPDEEGGVLKYYNEFYPLPVYEQLAHLKLALKMAVNDMKRDNQYAKPLVKRYMKLSSMELS